VSTLLVASTGGHLKELHHLRRQLGDLAEPAHWATFDTPQSRSLLASEQVHFVRFVGDRDIANTLLSVGEARRIMRDAEADAVVSTGAAVALPFIGLARARRLECRYIESAARADGPSLTGRLVSAIPGVRLFTQYRSWADRRWHFGGSVFDAFEGSERAEADGAIERVVVTLGTTRQVEFSRLIRRLVEVVPAGAEVLWQTGHTAAAHLGIDARAVIPESELSEAMAAADVVVAHAGVGTALAALEVGKCPLLVPRRPEHGELVDDHQGQIAADLARRGLAVVAEADSLTFGDLVRAASRTVGPRAGG
jgi:UDP-N-acetylglucosamine--N-acetylmuramyl-(pentapeptide) pyrophosphoryl-undecaprenol N-acetylglucosamine transferase